MSLYDYQQARQLVGLDVPFYTLIMAAMMRADTDNIQRLKQEWPEIWRELKDRYNSPGALLPEERKKEEEDGQLRQEDSA